MSESPKSENITRFHTPDIRLDDHRFQPESLPRAELSIGHAGTQIRRGTRRSMNEEQPVLLNVPESLYHRIITRDFENAIEDDDKSDSGSIKGRTDNARPGLASPTAGTGSRQNTFNRKSRRPSTATSRSASPPNSVEAFAERRRRPRAGTSGTVNSQAPSFLSLHHTRSNFTHERGSLIDEKPKDVGNSSESDQGSAGDDVCFPQQDLPSNPHEIDFDDLDDFVAAQEKRRTSYVEPLLDEKLPSISHAQQMQIVEDFKVKTGCQTLPNTSNHMSSTCNIDSDDTDRVSSDIDVDMDKHRHIKLPFQVPIKEQMNRWSFFSSALEETIHAPELGDLLMPGETFEHLFDLGSEGGCWWLDMLMPSEEEVEVICKAFNVHGLTREDIITQETREKVELFKSYYFVCFRSFYQMDKESEFYMEPVNVYAVVFREGILTFTFCPSPHAGNVRKRMGKLRDYVALGSDWICYALIDDIVDSFQPIIHVVEHESETIEDGIFTARAEDSRAVLRQIGESRKKVMSLIRLLGGKADVIKGFAKRCTEQYSIAPRQDVGMYLSDIQDHVVTMMSNLGHFEKMLSRSHANYLAQINVDNIAQGNRANEALSKVTFIATILVPLNLVCGLFGMNVPVPGRDSGGLGWFFGIVGMLVVFVLASLIVAKKRRYL